MSELLDRLGCWAAERVMRWIASRAEGTHREWVSAMRSEMRAVDGGVDQLRWVLGGVPMAWRMGTSSLTSTAGAISVREALIRNTLAIAFFAVLVNASPLVLPSLDGTYRPNILVVLLGLLFASRLRATGAILVMIGGVASLLLAFGFAPSTRVTPMVFGIGALRIDPSAWCAASFAAWWMIRRRHYGVAWVVNAPRALAVGILTGFIVSVAAVVPGVARFGLRVLTDFPWTLQLLSLSISATAGVLLWRLMAVSGTLPARDASLR